MTQLTEGVFAVEVPDGRDAFAIESVPEEGIWELLCCNIGEYNEPTNEKYIRLPPGPWQLLCTTKEASEEQAKGIVEHDTFIGGYKDYDTERFHHEDPFIKATDSLNSLLTTKGLDVNKNYVLLKKG